MISSAANSNGGPRQDFYIFGIPYWNATFEEFHAWWLATLESPERRSAMFCPGNPNSMNLAKDDPRIMEMLRRFDFFVDDGVGIRIAGRMRGQKVVYNFAGTDLVPRLFREHPGELSVFFYGGSKEVNEETVRRVLAAHPKVRLAGQIDGYVDPVSEALPAIAASNADVLLCALSTPKQEFFMTEQRERLNVKVAIPCGGMFDFFAGAKPRAPKAFRAVGMEWFYRLMLEPKRMFRRYVFGNPVFLARALASLPSDLRLARKPR